MIVKPSIQRNAEKACLFWGGYVEPPKLIKHRENAVFDVTFIGNKRAALRLHRPGYKSQKEIESEIWWTKSLAKEGFPVPSPLSNKDGNYLVELSPELVATAIQWVDGKPIGKEEEPDLITGGKIDFELGRLIGQLHNITKNLSFPDWFSRPLWDIDGLLGEKPHWGKFWEGKHLNDSEKEIFNLVRKKALKTLKHYKTQGGEILLIHADIIGENVFKNDTGIYLIDFDDCGYGFPIYDLSTATIQSLDHPSYQKRCNLILEGYDTVRTLRPIDIELFPVFSMLRVLATSAWIIPRASPNNLKIEMYKNSAIKQAVKFLEN